MHIFFGALGVLFFWIFLATLVIVLIYKLVQYLNNKPVFTQRKLARKILGVELAIALILYWFG